MFRKKKKQEDISKENVTDERDEKASSFVVAGKKPSRFPLFIKIISATLAVGSIALLAYSCFLLISDSGESSSEESYITLTGKNINESKQIYSRFGKEKMKKAADFALLGNKLFLSETKITPDILDGQHTADILGQGNSNFYLYNLTTDTSKFASGQSHLESNQYYIDLGKIDEGDYLVYSDYYNSVDNGNLNPYSLSTNEAISYTAYSLPDPETKARKRITIRNNSISPFLVINVKNCGSVLPTNYYDAVLFYAPYQQKQDGSFAEIQNSKDDTDKLKGLVNDNSDFSKANLKIKVADSLQDAFDSRCSYSFALEKGVKTTTSIYTKGSLEYHVNTLNDTSLKGYDANPEIRELTGYLGCAGQNRLGVTGNGIRLSDSSHIGKECFLLDETLDVLDTIQKFLTK